MFKSKYSAKDISGPCFNFDRVIASNLGVVNTGELGSSAPTLCFCDGMPFTIQVPIIKALGSGCDGTNPCWASSQFTGVEEAEGPYLTEATGSTNAGSLIVHESSASKAVYSFERFVPAPADGYPVGENTPVILLRVFQPATKAFPASSGYVQMLGTPIPDIPATTMYPTVIVDKAQAVSNKVMWGIIGRDMTTNCMLMYRDALLTQGQTALPMTQFFNWENTLFSSRGLAATGSSGTHSSFHGVVTTPTAMSNLDIVYNEHMTLIPGSLPEFDAAYIDSGAANVQWTITALPLTMLTARIYGTRYCTSRCRGAFAHYSGTVCSAVEALFPALLNSVSKTTCQADYRRRISSQAHTQKVLTIISTCGVGLELVFCIIILVRLLLQRKSKP